MITRTIEYPFHTATLQYHPDRKESDFEKSLMERYEAFLSEIQKRSDQVNAATERCYHEQLLEEEITAIVLELEEGLKTVIDAITEFKKSKHIHVNEFFLIREKYEKVNESYFELQEGKLELMRELITKNNEDFEDLFNWFEDESDGMFGRLDKYAEPLYKEDANYALDWASFFGEVDEMKGDFSKVIKAWDKAHKLRGATVEKSNACMELLNAFTSKASRIEDDMDGLDEQWTALNN